ncbi:MAG: ParA family partition ATPase [Pseudorhodobacter sp.]
MARVIVVAQQKGGAGKTTLAANLAIAFLAQGNRVAVLDTDPQGSLGRWFMARRDLGEDPGVEFATASAWGVGYEVDKLRKTNDIVLIDTPPKIDSDLRPALREADLVLIPVGASHLDLWALDGVLDMAIRLSKPTLLVLNRVTAGSRLAGEIAEAAAQVSAHVAETTLGQRVAYAESLGQGRGVGELPRSAVARRETEALADEVLKRLAASTS